jgi:hypothetical protein
MKNKVELISHIISKKPLLSKTRTTKMYPIAEIEALLVSSITVIDGKLSIPHDAIRQALNHEKPEPNIVVEPTVPELNDVKPFPETVGQLRKGASKKKKNPNAPKRPTSAYMLWLNENRSQIAKHWFTLKGCDDTLRYPCGHAKAGEPLEGRDKVTLITRKAGELWKELADEFKAPYQAKFEEASIAYKEAMRLMNPVEKKTKFRDTEIPAAPEGWSGPFEKSFIKNLTRYPNSQKSVQMFKSFDEAVTMANLLKEKCYGITRTKTGYSLRIGPKICKLPEDTEMCEVSWIKGNETPTFTEVAPKPKQTNLECTTPTVEVEEDEFHDAMETLVHPNSRIIVLNVN